MTILPNFTAAALELPTGAIILYLAWKSHHTHSARGVTFWLLITLGVVMTGFAIEALSLVIGMINLIKASESDLSTTF